MTSPEDTETLAYAREREAVELEAAENATDPAVKAIHEELAARYRDLATIAEIGSNQNVTPLRIVTG